MHIHMYICNANKSKYDLSGDEPIYTRVQTHICLCVKPHFTCYIHIWYLWYVLLRLVLATCLEYTTDMHVLCERVCVWLQIYMCSCIYTDNHFGYFIYLLLLFICLCASTSPIPRLTCLLISTYLSFALQLALLPVHTGENFGNLFAFNAYQARTNVLGS